MPRWSDDPATSATRIRVPHIGELRRTVDFYRAKAGLPAMTWTDNPLSTTTHFRWVHFTELRSAVQDLWTHAGLGTLPNWSVGTAPSSNRQTSARDINDLRSWVNTVDPPLNIWTGFHWCSPVDNSTPIPPTNQTPNQIVNSTMLWHGGQGVFDRVALHCYANNPAEFSNSTVAGNPALQYIQWMLQVDPTGWIYATECGGQCVTAGDLCLDLTPCFGDSACAGKALADFEANTSTLNAQSIVSGGFGLIVQAVYGYILDYSNTGATSNGRHEISNQYIGGYNGERGNLFP